MACLLKHVEESYKILPMQHETCIPPR